MTLYYFNLLIEKTDQLKIMPFFCTRQRYCVVFFLITHSGFLQDYSLVHKASLQTSDG